MLQIINSLQSFLTCKTEWLDSILLHRHMDSVEWHTLGMAVRRYIIPP